MQEKRNIGLDLLRIVAMLFIVLHHCGFWGAYRLERGLTWGMLVAFTLLTQWHVDCFVGISGWFGIKFSWRKFFRLWGVLLFYAVLSGAFVIFHPPFRMSSLLIPGGWFFGAYFILMFMSPLLNLAIDSCKQSGNFRSCILMGVVVLLNWAPIRLFSGVGSLSCDGFSVFNLMWVYLASALFRILLNRISLRKMLAYFAGGIIFSVAIEVAWFLARCRCFGESLSLNFAFYSLYKYNAPYTWLFSLALVGIFSRVEIESRWVRKFVGVVAPSTFGIYLFHEVTSFGHGLISTAQTHLKASVVQNDYCVVLLSAGIVFAFGLVVDLLRRGGVTIVSLGLHRWFQMRGA